MSEYNRSDSIFAQRSFTLSERFSHYGIEEGCIFRPSVY
jgi:hypothetical protein